MRDVYTPYSYDPAAYTICKHGVPWFRIAPRGAVDIRNGGKHLGAELVQALTLALDPVSVEELATAEKRIADLEYTVAVLRENLAKINEISTP